MNINLIHNLQKSNLETSAIQNLWARWSVSTWQGRTVYLLTSLAAAAALIAVTVYSIHYCFFKKLPATEPEVVNEDPPHITTPDSPKPLPETNPPKPSSPLAQVENPILPILDVLEDINTKEEAAQYLLTTEGFIKEAHDYCHPTYGYRGEVQGNALLRGVAAHVTKKFPEAFSPSVLSMQKEVHLEQYLTFMIKRFAHAHSMKGKIGLPSGKEIILEGFCEAYTIPMIASSYQEYAQSSNFFSEEDRAWIVENFNKTTSSDLTAPEDIQSLVLCIHDPAFMGPEAIGTGYDWHSTGTMFFAMKGNYLIHCNRGSYPSGIHVIRIPNLSAISEKTIWELCKRQEINRDQSFDLTTFIDEFNGELVHYQKMSNQKVGNCTYTSMKALFYSFMTIRYLMSHLSEDLAGTDSIAPEIWKQAFQAVHEEYKKWSTFDRKDIVFNSLLEEVQEELMMEKSEARDALLRTYESVLNLWWYNYATKKKHSQDFMDQVELVIQQIGIALMPTSLND